MEISGDGGMSGGLEETGRCERIDNLGKGCERGGQATEIYVRYRNGRTPLGDAGEVGTLREWAGNCVEWLSECGTRRSGRVRGFSGGSAGVRQDLWGWASWSPDLPLALVSSACLYPNNWVS